MYNNWWVVDRQCIPPFECIDTASKTLYNQLVYLNRDSKRERGEGLLLLLLVVIRMEKYVNGISVIT